MKVIKTKFKGLKIIKQKDNKDNRGSPLPVANTIMLFQKITFYRGTPKSTKGQHLSECSPHHPHFPKIINPTKPCAGQSKLPGYRINPKSKPINSQHKKYPVTCCNHMCPK